MSAVGNYLIRRGEIFLAAAQMKNTNETWDWLMESVTNGLVELDRLATTPEDRGHLTDLFDEWAGAVSFA